METKNTYILFGESVCRTYETESLLETVRAIMTDGSYVRKYTQETTPLTVLNDVDGWDDFKEISESVYQKIKELLFSENLKDFVITEVTQEFGLAQLEGWFEVSKDSKPIAYFETEHLALGYKIYLTNKIIKQWL